jgi:uncharacterized protein involved in type VI secretion and phage assembly
MPAATYVAKPLLEIDGQSASSELMGDILEISVEESLHLPAMFTIVLSNPYFPGRDQDRPWRHDALLPIGQRIRIGFESSSTSAPEFDQTHKGYVISGEITAIESQFNSDSQAPIVIRGYDTSHYLHRGRQIRSFQNMTDSDIVRKIVAEVGIEIGQIDDSGAPHDYVFQENQTNMEFLQQRSARLGFELFVQDNQLYFRKPGATETLKLKWLRDLHSFRVRVTSAEQVDRVEVRGWDYKRKQQISSDDAKTQRLDHLLTETEQGLGTRSPRQFRNHQTAEMVVVDQPVFSPDEASAIAHAIYNELAGEFVQADAKGEGDPRIRPGRLVELENMGKYAGKYYLTETRHLYAHGRYTSEFSVRGLRGGNLLELLSSRPHLKPGQTFLVGIVTNNRDPDNLSRVRVRFPTLNPLVNGSAHESNWARVVSLGAGKQRGMDWLPEINDEVLVGFEHGDIHRPYVMGSVWNGKDTPPEPIDQSVDSSGKVRLRTLKTRTGHQLQFVEEAQQMTKAGVELKTAAGHHLQINDTDRCIEIKTVGGHQIRLDDSGSCIEIRSAAGHIFKLDDVARNVSVRSTGSLDLQATTNISIQAVGSVSLRGSTIHLN